MNSRTLWKFFTSLRLTVVCLAIGIVLVFLGTLAQVDEGLYQAQARWFRGWFVWWGPQGTALHVPILPGGYLVGTVLLLNLIAAHIKRFVWGWRKVGIHLTHFGIILLLIGQLSTDMFSRESLMSLREGQTTSFSEDHRKNELVFSTDAGNGQNRVVSFDEKLVAKREEVRDDHLPFIIRVKEFDVNSDVLSHQRILEMGGRLSTALATVQGEYSSPEGLVAQAEKSQETPGRAQVWQEALKAIGEKDTNDLVAAAKRISAQPELANKLCNELKTRFQEQMLGRFKQQGGEMRFVAERLEKHEQITAESLPSATKTGAGKDVVLIPRPEGKSMDDRNMPAAILELFENGQSLGQWVVSPWLEPQEITVGKQTFQVAMRFERYYHPFTITLLKATHDVYRGTDIPKNFQSRVRVDNPETGEHREVDIYMNNPLRYAGLTFYQYQMGSAEAAAGGAQSSTLQVVKNPGWLTPYFGCAIVALGMIYQFLFHLLAFVAKRRAPEPVSKKARAKSNTSDFEPAVASGKQ